MLLSLGNLQPIQRKAGLSPVHLAYTAAEEASGEFTRLDPLLAHTTTINVPDFTDREGNPDYQRMAAQVDHAWRSHSAAAPGWITGAPGHLEELLRARLAMPPRLDGPTMLLTYAGRDFVAAQHSGSASATAVAKYLALSANTGAPALAHTTLTGELVDAGGGLVRATGTYGHTASATTFTVSNTFTANGSDTLPVTVHKAGLFDTATSGGNMPWESVLSSDATLSASGDILPVTWTFTMP